jgi:phage tail-like protein
MRGSKRKEIDRRWKRTFSLVMSGAVIGAVAGEQATALGAGSGRLPSTPITAEKRGYVAGKFGIEIDGVFAGWVQSVEGGHATSDVVNEKVGADHVVHKHIAGVKYEDIKVDFGTGMSKGFYQWIKDSFDHKYTRKNGAIISADFNYKELSRLTFTNALITEIGLPALDASSKDAAKMTLKFSPEVTRETRGGGAAVKYTADKGVQKKWLPANFRLKLDGLDKATSNVTKISALTVKQKVVEHAVGELRDYEKEPASIDFPNLQISLAEASANDLYSWHEDFVIKGNNTQDKEKGGTLEYLTPDLKTVIFTLTFQGLGIYKLRPEKVEAGSETIRRVKAEMYVEQMTFDFAASALS